jgi:predicted Zn-dependent protease
MPADVIRVNFRAGRRRSPDVVDMSQRLSEALASGAPFQELERLVEAVLSADALDEGALLLRANLALRRGDVVQAQRAAEKVLALVPHQGAALVVLAELARMGGDSQEALHLLVTAVNNEPSNADAHYHLARLYDSLSCRADGRRHWKRVLQLEDVGSRADEARERLRSKSMPSADEVRRRK